MYFIVLGHPTRKLFLFPSGLIPSSDRDMKTFLMHQKNESIQARATWSENHPSRWKRKRKSKNSPRLGTVVNNDNIIRGKLIEFNPWKFWTTERCLGWTDATGGWTGKTALVGKEATKMQLFREATTALEVGGIFFFAGIASRYVGCMLGRMPQALAEGGRKENILDDHEDESKD